MKIGFTLALLLLAVPALPARAEDKATSAAGGDPMAAWRPPKVTREAADRKEILALMQAMDGAGKKGDLEAAAALVDFPVTMITDDSKGEARGEAWSKEQWTRVMAPFYAKPMTEQVTHKPTIVLASDSLATVTDAWTLTMGKQKVTGRSASLLVRRNGRWLVKAMMEGGWGDMAMGAAEGGAGAGGDPPAR